MISLGTDGVAQGHSVELPLWFSNVPDIVGLQVDFVFNPVYVRSNGLSAKTWVPGVLADCGVVDSNRFRVVLLATNREPLPNGLVAWITFAAETNSPDGLLRIPLGMPPGISEISVTTDGVCVGGLDYANGQFLVGDAFGFADSGGRVQFRAINGATNIFLASTNLTTWIPIGTNVGTNELVFWIDRDVTNYMRRFYRKAP